MEEINIRDSIETFEKEFNQSMGKLSNDFKLGSLEINERSALGSPRLMNDGEEESKELLDTQMAAPQSRQARS